MMSITRYEPDRLRLAKMRNGIIAFGVYASHATNAPRRITDNVNVPTVTELLQPSCAAWMKPYTRPTMPATDSTAPRMSNRPESRSDEWMYKIATDHQCDTDRHVDEQHPPPVEVLGQYAAGEQSDGGTGRRHSGVYREGTVTLSAFGERGCDQRQRGRCRYGAADALNDPPD